MQHNNLLEDKGLVVEVAAFASALTSSLPEAKWKKDGNFGSKEPISVLGTRSPSPSTSSSTLSSSFGGTNTDKSENLLVGSDESDPKRNVAVSYASTEAAAYGGGHCSPEEEEFAAELQGVPPGLELNRKVAERLNFGLEDWEVFLSESVGHDQSPFRWISGDSEDSSFELKQLVQAGNPTQIEENADFRSGFEGMASGGFAGIGDVLTGPNYSPGFLVSELSFDSNNGKLCSVPNAMVLSNNSGNPKKLNFSSSPSKTNCLPQASTVSHQPGLQCDLRPQNFQPRILANEHLLQKTRNLGMLNSEMCDAGPEQPKPKRHNPLLLEPKPGSQLSRGPFLDPANESQQTQVAWGSQLNLLRPPNPPLKPLLVPKQEALEANANLMVAGLNQQRQQDVVYDQLYKAIELILAGNFSHAQGILARLNHQLSPFPPVVKPFHRSAVCFKEALQLSLLMPNRALWQSLRNPTPFDGMLKIGAYKMLSEVSPLIHFKNFTSNQALLEALGNEESIHIIDFDIGIGAQWSSFMQEIPRRNKGHVSLKITAFASPSTHNPFEISLIHESLTQLATDVGISFQLEVVNLDTFDPSACTVSSFRSSVNEAVAVNFPVWSCSGRPSMIPSLFCLIKQLSPKAVVLLDRGCERYDLPPSHHLLHALQYYEVLFESIDAANMAPDSANKIEKFIFHPKIESIVCGRLHSPNIMPPSANLLASAGFSSVPISSFSEAQAEWVVKRAQVKGFHVKKQNASLVLCWQGKDLLSASIWKC